MSLQPKTFDCCLISALLSTLPPCQSSVWTVRVPYASAGRKPKSGVLSVQAIAAELADNPQSIAAMLKG